MTSNRNNPTSKNGLGTVLLFLFITTTFLILINKNLQYWLPYALKRYQGFIEQSLTYLVFVSMATIALRAEGITIEMLGISRRDILYSIPVLLTLLTGHIIMANLKGGWGKILQRADFSLLVSTVIMNLIIIPFSEEYVYRGYVQNAFMKHSSVIYALIFSSLGFALVHLPVDLGGIMRFSSFLEALHFVTVYLLNRFIVSLLVFSILYYITGNLMIPVFIHGFFDLTLAYFPSQNSALFIFLMFVAPSITAYLVYFKKTNTIMRSLKQCLMLKRARGNAHNE